MKITIGQLRTIIAEEVAAAAAPPPSVGPDGYLPKGSIVPLHRERIIAYKGQYVTYPAGTEAVVVGMKKDREGSYVTMDYILQLPDGNKIQENSRFIHRQLGIPAVKLARPKSVTRYGG